VKDLSRFLCVLRFSDDATSIVILRSAPWPQADRRISPMPFSESRYSAIHPEIPQCGIEGCAICALCDKSSN
jgi:hypothetical protein